MDQTTPSFTSSPNDALTNSNQPRVSSHRPQAPYPQPSAQAAASSSSLTEPGKKTLERVRVSRATTVSSSASSSSTSLPRSILHRPQSARSGVSASVEKQHRPDDGMSASASDAAVIFGAEPSQKSPRLRPLSGSSSGHGHGRISVKKRPVTPGSVAPGTAATGSTHPVSWSAPHVPLPPALDARVPPSTPVVGSTAPPATTISARASHLVTPPGLASMHSSSPSSSASASTYATPPPQRRPSLASPLPATPIIPSHLPKAAVRTPPAPLNLAAASPSTPLRNPPPYHAATGSLSSPHGLVHPHSHSHANSSPLPSPPPGLGYHNQRMHSAPTPPSSHSSVQQGHSQSHHSSPSQGQGQTVQSQQAQGWASHAQYISVPRAGPSSLPDSPSTNAMMKRLLSKPAPISPVHGFGSGASGSESEGGRMGRADANLRTRSKTRLRNDGVRSEEDIEDQRGMGKVGGSIPPVDFDFDLDTLNRDIAMMGRWMARDASGSSEKMVSPATSMPDLKEKEKDKEKRVRNVLRRKLSANNSKPPPTSSSPPRASNAQPSYPSPKSAQPTPNSASSASWPSHLPAIGSLPPLSISPLGLIQETFTMENTAFIHPLPPHKQHQNSNATMQRSMSASAALPTSARVAQGGVQLQAISSQSPLLPQRHHTQPAQAPHGRASSSLHPHPQQLHLQGSSRSAASSQPSSRGSSPRRSPVVSEVLSASASASASATIGPTNTRLAPPARPQQSHSPTPHSPLTPTSPTSSKRVSSGKPTPAASLVEAYKKQEREREARRLAAEKERQERKEEREMALGMSRKMVIEAKSLISPRRHSVSELDALAAGRVKVQTAQTESGHGYQNTTTTRLAAPERALVGLSAGSTLTVNSFATTSSGPRVSVSDDDTANAAARAGLGFEAIEKLASSVMADAKIPSQSSTAPLPPASDARKREIRIRSPGSEDGEDGVDVTPYYTVFGSSATRVAAADRPAEEGWAVAAYGQGYWDSDVLGRPAAAEGGKEKEKEGKKESLSRTLSRKVSGRWKKQGGVVVGTLIDEDRQGRGIMRGRASMQERRKAGSTSRRDEMDREADARLKMRNRRSLRLSIDKFSDLLDREGDRPAVPPLVRGKSVGASVGVVASRAKEEEVDSDCDPECERDEAKKPSKTKKGKEKEKLTSSPSGSTGPSGGGNRFWKLMRRISVGGLKEKYRDASLSPPPPVPALPKDFQNPLHPLQMSRSNDSSLRQQPVDPRKNKSVSSSPTAATAVVVPKKAIASLSQAKVSATATAAGGSSQPRPSIVTRSSSPVSSDVASSKFFHRTHSAPSSTSSFEEEHPPPLPTTNSKFLQHIVPPSELGKAHSPKEEGASTSGRARSISVATQRMQLPDEDWQIVRSPSDELPSLPLPPRRPAAQPSAAAAAANTSETSKETDRSESPTIPSFSTNEAVNAFPTRRLSSTLSSRSRPSPSSPHASSPSSMLPPPSLISPQPATSLPPPPRPLRSAARPVTIAVRPPIIEEPPSIAPSIYMPSGRKSESHVQGRVSPQPALKQNRRSSGGMSGASSTATARAFRRRSSSFGGGTTASSVRSLSLSLTTTPPASSTTFTFREMDDANRPRPALTEHEKAARWEDLLERSARAGGTLHLAGGARVLASDRLKLSSKW